MSHYFYLAFAAGIPPAMATWTCGGHWPGKPNPAALVIAWGIFYAALLWARRQ